ncbi:hypothetical protein [Sphingosinicella sp. BN140058]|uniref:hypothetical protein n=1 Tax=Sphingosinicella sp. BN140058 TaxID=1892855 RepID=UPI001011B5C3|nr:hypothetical protein [Sphingosinicella sp. BN140058]QAY78490.1 hypothetical protein ETR14_19540 [Sphingosinicella sp. BN140058]
MTGFVSPLVTLSALAFPVDGSAPNIERITAEMAVQGAGKCGFGPATIRYEDEHETEIFSVPRPASATDAELSCLDSATGFGILVELPAALQPRFDAIREARASAMMKEEAHDWLSMRGLLGRVPDYVPGKTDPAAFTRASEHLCGPQAAGAFQSRYGPSALSPEWAMTHAMPTKEGASDALSCLLNGASAAGFSIVLIGNEAPGE